MVRGTEPPHGPRRFLLADVAQFFPVHDASTNLLAMNITKYWPLFERLSPDAAEAVAYGNAYALYFDQWAVPSGEEAGRYVRHDACYRTESLDPAAGEFVVGPSVLDDNGAY